MVINKELAHKISEHKKIRNSETNHNYVDRVRLKESPGGQLLFERPCRGSGWRQRSLSSIDLSINKKQHPQTTVNHPHPHEQYTGLYDLYSRIEHRKDLENLYSVNQNRDLQPNVNINDHNLYDQPSIINFGGPNAEACSLRRTRSLAVIREETFTDLQISGIRNRRSQLIPRAKLVEHSFFKERFQYKYPDENPRIITEHQAPIHIDDKKTEENTFQNDKSDLDSLDSNYFKNSLHQQKNYESEDNQDSSTEATSDFQVHCENEKNIYFNHINSTDLAETTTSDSSDNYSTKRENSDSITEIKIFDEILLTQDLSQDNSLVSTTDTSLTTTDSSKTNTTKTIFDGEFSTSTSPNEKLIIEVKSEKNCSLLHKIDDIRSVISYDSIYLSSECSDRLPDDHIDEINLEISEANNQENLNIVEIKVSDSSEIKRQEEEELNKLSIDSLYSEVTKNKPKVVSLEPKPSKQLTTFSDYSLGGTLERLTLISTGKFSEINQNSNKQPNQHQFYSLPDTQIGKSLIASERIDAKLRETCDIETNHIPLNSQNNIAEEEENSIYDSISRFGRAHKRLRQRESCEIVVLNSISIDEQPKEAPSIEVEPSIKEFKSNPNKKYLSELGLDSDCGNSLDTFNSTVSDPDSLNENLETQDHNSLVNLGGKQVIVDEIQLNDLNKKLKTNETFYNNNNKLINFIEKKNTETKIPTVEEITTKKETIISLPEANIKNPIRKVYSYDINKKLEYKTNKLIRNYKEVKMSRPQIMHIVDSKRIFDVELIKNNKSNEEETNNTNSANQPEANDKEFHEKVDSVRYYWSKLASDKVDGIELKQHIRDDNNLINKPYVTVDDIVKNITNKESTTPPVSPQSIDTTDFQSFCPTVEIIELENQKHAAIVKSNSMNEDINEFDHIRYRIMKSDMFQKNLLSRNKKEAQFDGLIQYLHDYSFQELLSHNNVVIIEPVRTKIEKITEKPPKSHKLSCKITGGAGEQTNNENIKNNLKRHFFYHPVRVNKELLDEELPNPDTVKNVRKLFEGSLRFRNHNNHTNNRNSNPNLTDDSKICGQHKNPESLRKKALRYLTIDTSYGNTGMKKWDSASLSSGISSGDLSSPCECGEENSHFSSEENLCDDFCESHYVSQDILEKIRECGSSVTYYGGRVVDKKSSNLSPMTKAIIQEIRGDCSNCQPNKVNETVNGNQDQDVDNYLGVKFKLVKSNSCSSRLELVGTQNHKNDKCNMIPETTNRSPSPEETAEESVRTLVNRLETGAINQSTTPRIIESKCIEKIYDTPKPTSIETVTINNQLTETKSDRLGPVDLITSVTVNNHINLCNQSKIATGGITSLGVGELNNSNNYNNKIASNNVNNKVCRNKNVDLAFSMSSSSSPTMSSSNQQKLFNNKPVKDIENIVKQNMLFEKNENNQTFEEAKEMLTTAFENITRAEERAKLNDSNSDSNLTKIMKWDSGVNTKFDEKFYVANDLKLKEKKKYDEMEFEEFEVLDPKNECYDSLNEIK